MDGELTQVLLHLPTRIKTHREVHRLTQRALAERVGTSVATICRIEKGHDYNVSSLMLLLAYLEQSG